MRGAIAPSLKTLVESGLCNKSAMGATACAKLVRSIIKGKTRVRDNHEQFPVTNKWICSCHHLPKLSEIKMSALNELLGCHGVEVIGDFNNYPVVCHFTYLNTGDTYSTTIIRLQGSRYVVSSWGAEVERLEKKGIAIP